MQKLYHSLLVLLSDLGSYSEPWGWAPPQKGGEGETNPILWGHFVQSVCFFQKLIKLDLKSALVFFFFLSPLPWPYIQVKQNSKHDPPAAGISHEGGRKHLCKYLMTTGDTEPQYDHLASTQTAFARDVLQLFMCSPPGGDSPACSSQAVACMQTSIHFLNLPRAAHEYKRSLINQAIIYRI